MEGIVYFMIILCALPGVFALSCWLGRNDDNYTEGDGY